VRSECGVPVSILSVIFFPFLSILYMHAKTNDQQFLYLVEVVGVHCGHCIALFQSETIGIVPRRPCPSEIRVEWREKVQ